MKKQTPEFPTVSQTVTGATKVPLHIRDHTPKALELIANHALRMFEINPRGFRRNKDGSSPFVMQAFVAAGMTQDEPDPSKRAQAKRLAKGIHLLKMKENPFQKLTRRTIIAIKRTHAQGEEAIKNWLTVYPDHKAAFDAL